MVQPPQKTSARFFVTGGTLPPDAGSYVERSADRELLHGLLAGEFCYVLTARQMGKSSLMVRSTARLRESGAAVVVLDLTAIGQNVSPEQWYDGLGLRLGQQLRIEEEWDAAWQKRDRLGPCQRFFTALTEEILPLLACRAAPQPPPPLVVFIDELDVVRSLPFRTDEFFAALRECYTRRLENPDLNRLVFGLFGVATPSQLIQDVNITPFNIGRRIELRDFSSREAVRLADGLKAAAPIPPPAPEAVEDWTGPVLARILSWTHGHPYLTQKLCLAIAETARALSQPAGESGSGGFNARLGPLPISGNESVLSAFVDALTEHLFLSERAREKDDNLIYVRDRLLRAESGREPMLTLYHRIRQSARVADDASNPTINHLLLAGLVRVEHGSLVVRNRIYHDVFSGRWIRAHLPGVAPAEERSVAVLPFVNSSSGPEDEFLSDGITEDLISALARIPGLRVPARTSSFAFKGRNEDIRVIAGRLDVSHIVEGSVRRAGDQLRITTRLIVAADGSPVWSEQFDRAWQDVFGVQDEIVRSIVAALKIRLMEETSFAVRPKEDARAYQATLRGRYHLNRGTPDGFPEALRHFEEALSLRPDMAAAHAGIAETRLHQYFWNLVPKEEALEAARTSARKAVDLDEHLPEAHIALGLVRGILDWDWESEERHLQQAIELNPNAAHAYAYLAMLQAMRLRFDESVATARTATILDPLSPLVHHHFAMALYFAGRSVESEAEVRRTLELEPHFFRSQVLLSNLCQDASRNEEAIAACQKGLEKHDNPLLLATLGCAQARAGRTSDARRSLARLEEWAASRPIAPSMFARVHMALGDSARALSLLKDAFRIRSGDVDQIHLYPLFKPLHNDPRFRRMVNDLGLPLPSPESPAIAMAAAPPPRARNSSRWIWIAISILVAVAFGAVILARLRGVMNAIQP